MVVAGSFKASMTVRWLVVAVVLCRNGGFFTECADGYIRIAGPVGMTLSEGRFLYRGGVMVIEFIECRM
jgi:hypothetical protein